MSSDDTFIARWSRLKRSAAQGKKARKVETPAPDAQQDGEAVGEKTAAPVGPGQQAKEEQPFDPATLPSIETIVADTDIRDFLRSEVPAHLTRAALRRAWSADPAIRDFIEIAENQWDFTDPAAIPGFGPLEAADDVPHLVRQAMGGLKEAENEAASSQDAPAGLEDRDIGSAGTERGMPAANPQPHPDVDPGALEVADGSAALQDRRQADGERPAAPARKSHGSALPR